MKILEDFKNFKATKLDLQKNFGEDLYNVDIINCNVVDAFDVINAIKHFINNDISKNQLLQWVNIIWFTELYEYDETQCDTIASVITVLETVDEDEITNNELFNMIKCLQSNIEYKY